jgi:TatA/E family protein of Tat protein translocase
MFGIGPLELVLILVVALLVFGPKRVPELARTLGRGLAEFRRASNDLRQSLALDEIQQDLRRDLTGNQTIHKPEKRPDDRPAQTGDDVGSPEKPAAAMDEASDPDHHDPSEEADSDKETLSNSPVDPDLGNVPVSGSSPVDPRRG